MVHTQQLVESVADAAHEAWKVVHYKARPGQPRPKPVDNEAWSAAHGGALECDIAALSNAELPPRWSAENYAGARLAVDLVLAAVECGERLDDAFMEKAASKVHDGWVERNRASYTEGVENPETIEQLWPYDKLSPALQEMDRVFVRNAIKALERFATDERQQLAEAAYKSRTSK